MNLDLRRDVYIPLRAIEQRNKNNREQGFRETMVLLGALLNQGLGHEDAEFVYSQLARVHYLYGRPDEAESVILASTKRFPDSPLTWIEASRHYWFYLGEHRDIHKALQLAEHAVEVARASGTFVVHALNELCRAAEAARNYRLLEASIKSLLAHSANERTIDSAFECDFLVGLPEGSIDRELAHRLRERCRKS